jgi:hypothetical protein
MHLGRGTKHEREPLSEKESVAFMNEKLVVLHADLRPPRLLRLRRIARRGCEYNRCGKCSVLIHGGYPFKEPHSGAAGICSVWATEFSEILEDAT